MRDRKEVEEELEHINKEDPAFPIDKGIWALVLALRMHEFNTCGSCEGHRFIYWSNPFVTFESKDAEEKWMSQARWDEQQREWQKEKKRLRAILEEFHAAERAPWWFRLVLREGDRGHLLVLKSRIAFVGSIARWLRQHFDINPLTLLPKQLDDRALRQQQIQMCRFANFLLRKIE